MSAQVNSGPARYGDRAEALFEEAVVAVLAPLDEAADPIGVGALRLRAERELGEEQALHVVVEVHPVHVVEVIGRAGRDGQPAATVPVTDVLEDRGRLGEDAAVVLDDRRRRRRMQRHVLGRLQAVGPALVPDELVREPELLHQPDDAIGLRDPEVVDGEHGGECTLGVEGGRRWPGISRPSRSIQRELEWMDAFVREKVEPLDLVLGDAYDVTRRARAEDPAPAEGGGEGARPVGLPSRPRARRPRLRPAEARAPERDPRPLALRAAACSAARRPTRATPRSSRTTARAAQKERYLKPLLERRDRLVLLDDRAARAAPIRPCSRPARCATATTG